MAFLIPIAFILGSAIVGSVVGKSNQKTIRNLDERLEEERQIRR